MTPETDIHDDAERIAAETFMRPTPEQIDELASRYESVKAALNEKKAEFESIEQEAIAMVTQYGIVPPYAEKSRRLNGRVAELTVTKGDQLSVNDDRVADLKEALEANGRGEFFGRLFTLRSKYEVVEGAADALKREPLPKRLTEKVLNLWGRCITVKPKKPSLKVVIAGADKSAKKGKKQ
jgi:hypothetical protein